MKAQSERNKGLFAHGLGDEPSSNGGCALMLASSPHCGLPYAVVHDYDHLFSPHLAYLSYIFTLASAPSCRSRDRCSRLTFLIRRSEVLTKQPSTTYRSCQSLHHLPLLTSARLLWSCVSSSLLSLPTIVLTCH